MGLFILTFSHRGDQTVKPSASLRTHHFVAAAVWSLVGISLMIRGGLFLHAAGRVWLMIPALVAGTAKSLYLLDKTARKNLLRLAGKEDGDCLGGVYSIRMWGMVALMIGMGWLLRHSGLPAEVVGVIYGAIGWALLLSSRLVWQRAAAWPSAGSK